MLWEELHHPVSNKPPTSQPVVDPGEGKLLSALVFPSLPATHLEYFTAKKVEQHRNIPKQMLACFEDREWLLTAEPLEKEGHH